MNRMNSQRQMISQQLNRRIKILGLITIISVAIVVAISCSSLLFQQKERFIAVKRNIVSEIDNYLSGVFSNLYSVNEALMVSKDQSNLLNMALIHKEKIKDIYLIKNNQVIGSSVDMTRYMSLSDKKLLAWVDDASSTNTYISSPFFDHNSIPYVYVAIKVRNELDDVLQTLVARLDLSGLWITLNRFNDGEYTNMIIYDQSGFIILHSSLSVLNKRRYIEEIFPAPEYAENLDLKLKRKNKNDYFLLTSQRIPDTQWYLMIESPLSSVTNTFFLSIFALVLVFSLIVFLIYQINRFTRKSVIESISLLQKGVEELESGNLSHRIEHIGNNELGYIASVLNKLSFRLSSTLKSLKRRISELDESKQALEKSEASHRAVVNNVKEVLFNTDSQACWQFLNPAWEKFTGFSTQDCIGRNISEFIHSGDLDHCALTCQKILTRQLPSFEGEVRILKKSGGYLFMQIFASLSLDDQGNTLGVTGTLNDITDRKIALNQLKLTSKVYIHAREAIVICDAKGTIIDVNNSYKEMTGYDIDETLNKNIGIELNNLNPINFDPQILLQAKHNGYWQGETKQRRKNGDEFFISFTISIVKEIDEVQNYVALFSDVTEQNQYKQQLEYSAHYDSLTGLPNRQLFSSQMQKSMQMAIQEHYKIAICYLDLDGFKEVNDIYGHTVGDRLLIEISKKMPPILRKQDMIARLGGDEFVAVFIDTNKEECTQMLEHLLDEVSKPIDVEGRNVQVSASLGVTFYPQTEADFDADQLLRQADQAMYQAKILGKNRYHFFDADKDRDLRGINQLLEQISKGLHHDEFVLFYQPKVNMKTGKVLGFEALIRWQHPERGLLSPYYFLESLKNQPLSIEVGNWVIRQAVSQLSKWNAQQFKTSISVNVDSFQLQKGNFIESLTGIMKEFPDVDSTQLEFEILESNALEDISLVSQVIKECRDMGVHFSLDDFGTGFSSLSHLKNLPVRELKIDRSFVHDMLDDLDDLSILDGTLGLAESFRRTVIAEGVETQEQGDILLKLGCEAAQGYFIAKPMPENNVLYWFKNWQTPDSWKQQQVLPRQDVPLLFLLLGHQSWIKKLFEFIELDEQDCSEDWRDCRFYNWIKEGGHLEYKDNELTKELIDLHDEIHKMADVLVAQKESSVNLVSDEMKKAFRNTCDRFIMMLKALASSKLD